TQTENEPFLAFKRDPLPDNPNWREACGECHTAFHPTLLPARSWNRMMDEQSEHFGEDLGLEAEAVQEIQNFLVANAAESGITEPAHKVNKSIPKDQAPLRITETAYWKKKHKDIEDKYWKSKKVGSKAACEACHRDAKQGWFEDSNMKLPNLQ
ncbi:MAG: diheme cytochrome c, partial [Gammaproteobacteria bacterium]|nr:diheme cytochrome c [Gammaproteobacteria bacterium]